MTNGASGTRAMARWALLCLLAFGVLGMHSLGLGHEGHAASAAEVTATFDIGEAAAAHAGHGAFVSGADYPAGYGGSISGTDQPAGDSSGMAAMCLAILAALTAAFALAGRFLPRQGFLKPTGLVRTIAAGWRGPPYSLLVAKIAVARI